jgi:hypothetical protein
VSRSEIEEEKRKGCDDTSGLLPRNVGVRLRAALADFGVPI